MAGEEREPGSQPAQAETRRRDEEDPSASSSETQSDGEDSPLDLSDAFLRELERNPQFRSMLLNYSYSGPLPPPSLLREYDSIVPGSARQIMDGFHDQTSHRIRLESSVTSADIRKSFLGLAAGFIVAVLGLVIAWDLARQGQELAASVIGGATLASIVGSLVYANERGMAELMRKRRAPQHDTVPNESSAPQDTHV